MIAPVSTTTLMDVPVEDRQKFSGVGLRALFRVEEVFRLSDVEIGRLLGGASRSDVKEWKRSAQAREPIVLPNEAYNRLRAVLLVIEQLGKKFPRPHDKAEEWLRRNNGAHAFGGRSPIAMMMDIEIRHLFTVVRYAQHNPLITDTKAPVKPERRRART